MEIELPEKKRCPFCRRWFRPHPRVALRQWACSREPCQQKRRVETQANWRVRNPEYPAAYRLQRRAAEARAASEGQRHATGELIRRPAPLAVPVELRRLPWDHAQDEIGVVATDLVALAACTVLAVAKRLDKG